MQNQNGFVRSEGKCYTYQIILSTNGTNGCVKGDTMCQNGLTEPWCRATLTRIVGIVQAVLLLPLVWQKGIWTHCVGQLRGCYLIEGRGVSMVCFATQTFSVEGFAIWDCYSS